MTPKCRSWRPLARARKGRAAPSKGPLATEARGQCGEQKIPAVLRRASSGLSPGKRIIGTRCRPVVPLRSDLLPSGLGPGARREAGRSCNTVPVTKIQKTEEQWRAELTPEQYRVLREKGTERPFSGKYDHTFEPGTYRCAGCGTELFDSDAKYDSGCGWPAFSAPADGDAIQEETDTTFGMTRTEVLCANCGGHLGHVFPDGPHPTGLRYCINSAALQHEKAD